MPEAHTDRDEESESEGVITKTHHSGYTTANIELGALFGDERQYSVTAAVLNIFDKEYYVNDSLPEAGVHAVVTANARFLISFLRRHRKMPLFRYAKSKKSLFQLSGTGGTRCVSPLLPKWLLW